MDRAELEGIATRELEDWGGGSPIDLFDLARDSGFELRFEGPPRIVGNVIYVDPSVRPEKQRWDVGHELSHALLREARIPDTEDAVQYLTGALALARIDFLRDVRQVGRHPFKLKARHPLVSHEAIGRRIVALCDPCVLWVWDSGPRENRYKVVSPGWRWPLRDPTALELRAMNDALVAGAEQPVEPMGGVIAWAVVDPPWTRRLCLADGDVLLSAG